MPTFQMITPTFWGVASDLCVALEEVVFCETK